MEVGQKPDPHVHIGGRELVDGRGDAAEILAAELARLIDDGVGAKVRPKSRRSGGDKEAQQEQSRHERRYVFLFHGFLRPPFLLRMLMSDYRTRMLIAPVAHVEDSIEKYIFVKLFFG